MPAIPNTMTPNGGGAEICPENNVPVEHARNRYNCRCDTCRRPSDPEPDPEVLAEMERKQLQREKLSEEIRAGTSTTYRSDAQLRASNAELYEQDGLEATPERGESSGTPDADAFEDVKGIMEGVDV